MGFLSAAQMEGLHRLTLRVPMPAPCESNFSIPAITISTKWRRKPCLDRQAYRNGINSAHPEKQVKQPLMDPTAVVNFTLMLFRAILTRVT
jgi:hypothetical protein